MKQLAGSDSFKTALRGSLVAIALCVVLTVVRIGLEYQTGITEGAAGNLYLIAVVISAMRWGIIPGLVASAGGAFAAAFFFYDPGYTLAMANPAEIFNLVMYCFVAVAMSYLAARLKREIELARRREIDMRDLYAFSRRLAIAFDVSDIHAAIEDHIAYAVERRVVLFASARDAANSSGRHAGVMVPQQVRDAVVEIASDRAGASGPAILHDAGQTWLVQAVSPNSLEFGVIAVNFGRVSQERSNELRVRVGTVLADATATLERLGVAHAITEARMRSQTDQLREALIGSVSHELRTPLASIMGAATVIGAAPALAGEVKLKALIHDVHNEALRLNHDIQNLLDASRISSEGVKPHIEWAEVSDIINSAVERCRRRLGNRRLLSDLPPDLPLIHIDPVLVEQALVQVFDNAAKYSPPDSTVTVRADASDARVTISVADQGAGLTAQEKGTMFDRFSRGERHAATTSGSGLGLWIAQAFLAANGGTIDASSPGPGKGAVIAIQLPVAQAAVASMESEADE